MVAGHAEASTGYHVLATQLFAVPFLVARAGGDEFSPEYAARLAAMFGWIATLADDRGRLAHIGDCDDGRVELLPEDLEQMKLPPAQRHSLHVASLLKLGEALFPALVETDPARRPNVRVLRNSGIAVARVEGAELIFLAMPNGLGGRGSHTHNDKLSLVLRASDDELLCDSGTGCYTRDAALRNRLRATAAHNTLSIDGHEQNRINPSQLFRIGNDASPTPIAAAVNGDSITLSAAHSVGGGRGGKPPSEAGCLPGLRQVRGQPRQRDFRQRDSRPARTPRAHGRGGVVQRPQVVRRGRRCAASRFPRAGGRLRSLRRSPARHGRRDRTDPPSRAGLFRRDGLCHGHHAHPGSGRAASRLALGHDRPEVEADRGPPGTEPTPAGKQALRGTASLPAPL